MSENQPFYNRINKNAQPMSKPTKPVTAVTPTDKEIEESCKDIFTPNPENGEKTPADVLSYTHVIALFKHHPNAPWQVFPRLFRNVDQAKSVLKAKFTIMAFKAITVELPPVE